MSGRSFSQGVGAWIGAAEVYDAHGAFAGMGRDQRTVVADDGAGEVTVDVTFDGPFSLGGRYTIVDHGDHRHYVGPLNLGLAEALDDGLIAAHNYWPDLGLNQRFFLMVLPDGSRQLSLALINRGEQPCWTVIGEYQRQTEDGPELVPPVRASAEQRLFRPGTWTGELTVLHADGSRETSECREVVTAGSTVSIEGTGTGFGPEGVIALQVDGESAFTAPGDIAGSVTTIGGRALSGHFVHAARGFREWRREVVAADGSLKAVVRTWYQGEERLATVFGVLNFSHG